MRTPASAIRDQSGQPAGEKPKRQDPRWPDVASRSWCPTATRKTDQNFEDLRCHLGKHPIPNGQEYVQVKLTVENGTPCASTAQTLTARPPGSGTRRTRSTAGPC